MIIEAPYKKGDKLVIEKGVMVYSFHPSYSRDGRQNGKKRTVTVDHVIPGYKQCPGYEDFAAQICWAGSGRYWYWVKWEPDNT